MARQRAERRAVSRGRPPRGQGRVAAALRAWSGTIGGASLLTERLLRRR